MAYKFEVLKESIKRAFSVYIVIATNKKITKLYVGKTGDNRIGCNPVISRAGNHFSYNRTHNQIRNKLRNPEQWEYLYVFDHFYSYSENREERKQSLEKINEIERWLNQEVQEAIKNVVGCELLNPYSGRSMPKHKQKDREKLRKKLRSQSSVKQKINGILQELEDILTKK